HYRPSEPHWYLSPIGVEASHRNKGHGASLLERGLDRCDREHRAAYLWSSKQEKYLPLPPARLRGRNHNPGRLIASEEIARGPLAKACGLRVFSSTISPVAGGGEPDR